MSNMSGIIRSTVSGKIVEQNPQVYFTLNVKYNTEKNLKCDACGARIPVYDANLAFHRQLASVFTMGRDTYSEPLSKSEKLKKGMGMEVLVSNTPVVHEIVSSGASPLEIMNGRKNKTAFSLDNKKKTANLDDACGAATATAMSVNTQGNTIMFLDNQSMQEALNKQRENVTATANTTDDKSSKA